MDVSAHGLIMNRPIDGRLFGSREAAIAVTRQIVENLRVDSGQAALGEINPVRLAQYLRIEVRQMPLNDPDLSRTSPNYVNSIVKKWADSSRVYVVVNESDELQTRRFSIAHELGHLAWDAYEASQRQANTRITADVTGALLKGQALEHTRRKHDRPLVSPDRHDFDVKDNEYFCDQRLHLEYMCDLFANFWLLPNYVLPEIANTGKSPQDKASDLVVSSETLSNGMEYYAMSLANGGLGLAGTASAPKAVEHVSAAR